MTIISALIQTYLAWRRYTGTAQHFADGRKREVRARR
jgi:hypothetical protein